MKLSQLLASWMPKIDVDCEILNIQNDSRRIAKGDLFLAYAGAVADGRNYINQAISQGAAAVAYDPDGFTVQLTDVPMIPIPNLSLVLGDIANMFYSAPSQSLDVLGVTGTNGKTTIAYQLAQAHELLGHHSAYIGTIGQGPISHLQELSNTTPDGLCIQKLLAEYRASKTKVVCMEVSSHALSQQRVTGISFRQAIFTNLTLDHLDYHHTMHDYAEAKALLFARPELEWAIINYDDSYQEVMSANIKPHVKKLTYGFNEGCDIRVTHWNMTLKGTEIEVLSPWGTFHLHIQALGQFNIYNSLAIFASLMAYGYPASRVVDVISQLKPAAGRMEIVSKAPYVLVDYAHTPDALEKALMTLNELKTGALWVVFGCGGDRDKSKRPVMGKAASTYADRIVITSDNPRTEEPQTIVDEIAKGVDGTKPVTLLVNREEAIAFALNEASPDDIILIAGKGHESYQQIGSVKHHFSDQEVVRRLIDSK